MQQRQTVYILCGTAETNPNYTSWLGGLSLPYEIVTHLPDDWTPPDDAAVVVSHIQYRHREVAALRKSRDANIPVLILADGILEYRNSWENPNLPSGAVFSPVIGHKLASIGAGQSKWVGSWGNDGVCEEVGLPRLDAIVNTPVQNRESDGDFRVLVITARSPGFDEGQIATTKRSIADLRNWFDKHREFEGRRITPIWRISPEIAEALDIDMTAFNMDGNELVEWVDTVDAVITTPSTAMLEAMLRGRPTALLDYHQCPHYVSAGWLISHSSQITTVISELLAPASAKMDYQRLILSENLQLKTPAAQRLTKLVEAMAEIGNQCQNEGRPLTFPANILPPVSCSFSPNEDQREHEGSAAPTLIPTSNLQPTIPSETAAESEASDPESKRLRVELAFAEDSIKEKRESIESLQSDLRKANRNAELQETRKAELRSDLKERSKDLRTVERKSQQLERKLAKSESRAHKSKQFDEAQIRRLTARKTKLQNTISKIKTRLSSCNQRRKRVESRRKTLQLRIARLQRRVSGLERKTKQLRQQLAAIEQHWFVGRCLRLARRFDSRLKFKQPSKS